MRGTKAKKLRKLAKQMLGSEEQTSYTYEKVKPSLEIVRARMHRFKMGLITDPKDISEPSIIRKLSRICVRAVYKRLKRGEEW